MSWEAKGRLANNIIIEIISMELREATFITPIGLVALVILSILIISVPKRYVLVPLFAITSYMTMGQNINVAGLSFSMLRCIILFGWIRLFLRREIFNGKFNSIDKILIVWLFSNIIMYTIQNKTMDAFINRMGFSYNAIGLYFLYRSTVSDFSDIERAFRILAYIVVPLAAAMIVEWFTMKNVFSFLGGVPLEVWKRGSLPRCQGPFRHAILAGTYGATMAPFFTVLWFSPANMKILSIIGILAATAITVTSYSSGPAIAFIAGGIALAMWPLRNKMRPVLWGLLFLIMIIHVTMKAPIWYLMARFAGVIGGTGWHRAYIVDQAISHIDEWWLVGTSYTAHWMPYALPSNPDMADMTNQYLVEGVRGGVLTMFLFIGIIFISFKAIGKGVRIYQFGSYNHKMIWAVGAALFTHVITFMSVSYFDQIIAAWYLLLAMISAILDKVLLANDEMKKEGIRPIFRGAPA